MKIGDYVRTKNGRIFRWSSLCTTDIEDYMEHTRKILFIEDEIKSSQNIIDLIKVGDYVNGYLVIEKDINNELRYIDLKDRNMKYVKYLDIKSILTKEAFESMEYKLGE